MAGTDGTNAPGSGGAANGFTVRRMDHVAVVVTDVDRARRFYVGVLGLDEVSRPESFDFPGAWFQTGPEVVHLPGQPASEGVGRRHFCLWVDDVHAAARHLGRAGCRVIWEHAYKIKGIDRFFTSDPDGNRIEIQGPEAGDRSA